MPYLNHINAVASSIPKDVAAPPEAHRWPLIAVLGDDHSDHPEVLVNHDPLRPDEIRRRVYYAAFD